MEKRVFTISGLDIEIEHNKFAIYDNDVISIGSFDWRRIPPAL
jgi:hypothetical protein